MTDDKHTLSLPVREKLMRGQQDEAVALLMNELQIDQPTAESLISQYRAGLRERRLELEALKMQHDQQKQEQAEKTKIVRYIAWGVGVLVLLALIWLLSKAI